MERAIKRTTVDLDVEVPYFRDGDVQREADLIEEVARVHGLNRLPSSLPAPHTCCAAMTWA